jgi:hypothetical protein
LAASRVKARDGHPCRANELLQMQRDLTAKRGELQRAFLPHHGGIRELYQPTTTNRDLKVNSSREKTK